MPPITIHATANAPIVISLFTQRGLQGLGEGLALTTTVAFPSFLLFGAQSCRDANRSASKLQVSLCQNQSNSQSTSKMHWWKRWDLHTHYQEGEIWAVTQFHLTCSLGFWFSFLTGEERPPRPDISFFSTTSTLSGHFMGLFYIVLKGLAA